MNSIFEPIYGQRPKTEAVLSGLGQTPPAECIGPYPPRACSHTHTTEVTTTHSSKTLAMILLIVGLLVVAVYFFAKQRRIITLLRKKLRARS